MALDETNPLAHHANAWTCTECGVRIPILDGFGESIRQFHALKHTVIRISAENDRLKLVAAEATRAASAATERALRAEAMAEEQRKINLQLNSQLQMVFAKIGHAAQGMSVELE